MARPCCTCVSGTDLEADLSPPAIFKEHLDHDREVIVDVDATIGHANLDPEPSRPFDSVVQPTRKSVTSSTIVGASLSSSSSLTNFGSSPSPSPSPSSLPTPAGLWQGGPGPERFQPAATRHDPAKVQVDAENEPKEDETDHRASQASYVSEVADLPKFPMANRFCEPFGRTWSKDTKGSYAASPRQTETSTIRSCPRILSPPVATFDLVPELTSFSGCTDLLRGTRLSTILRARNNVLRTSPGSEATFKLSQEVDRLDVFLSHNWCNSWHLKCLALVHHFNFGSATFATLVVMAVIAILTVAGLVPMIPKLHGESAGCLARLLGVPCFFLFLFFFEEIRSVVRRSSGPAVFLDKTCISQTNLALQRRGIEKLSAFLSNSDVMLALWSDEYLEKLWTVYETASFLALRPSRCMVVLPLRLILVHYLTFSWTWVLGIFFMVLRATSSKSSFVESFLTLLFCTFMCAAGRVWALVAREVDKSLGTFDVKHCICAREEDRTMVCRNIAVLMRIRTGIPCATDAEALEMFNELARYELPGVFTSCLHPVALQYHQMLVWSSLWYGTTMIDEVGAKIYHGMPLYEVLCETTALLFHVILVLPLAASTTQRITHCWIDQRGWWTAVRIGICYGLMVNIPTTLLILGSEHLAEVCKENPMGWIGFAILWTCLGIAVRWSFTAPLKRTPLQQEQEDPHAHLDGSAC